MEKEALNPIETYPSNSMRHKIAKDERATSAKRQRKEGRRQAVFVKNHADEALDYVLNDIVAPAAKDMLSSIATSLLNAIKDAIDTAMFGSPRAKRGYDSASYTDYSSRYKSNDRQKKLQHGYFKTSISYSDRFVRKSGSEWNDVPPRTSTEINTAMQKLRRIFNQYGEVSVGDFYDAIGVMGDFTDRKWGWVDIDDMEKYRGKDGYYIDLPDPMPL